MLGLESNEYKTKVGIYNYIYWNIKNLVIKISFKSITMMSIENYERLTIMRYLIIFAVSTVYSSTSSAR